MRFSITKLTFGADELKSYNLLTAENKPVNMDGIIGTACLMLKNTFSLTEAQRNHCVANPKHLRVGAINYFNGADGPAVDKLELFHEGYDQKGSCVFISEGGRVGGLSKECYDYNGT